MCFSLSRINQIRQFAVFLISTLILFAPSSVLASFDAPLELTLSLSGTEIDINNQGVVSLSLINNSPFEIFGIDVDYHDGEFKTKTIKSYPVKLAPFASSQAVYEITPKSNGVRKMNFSINYSWLDDKGMLHNRIEIVSTDDVKTVDDFAFDWPSYLIPLIIGFVFGQIGTILTDWYKSSKEYKLRVEQANGILLAGMQTAKKCIEMKDEITFSFWEDLVVKGNLYPALLRYSKKIKQPDLARRFADISIRMKEYNTLRRTGSLNEDFIIDIEDELMELISKLEDN